jgi:hypothetical protein
VRHAGVTPAHQGLAFPIVVRTIVYRGGNATLDTVLTRVRAAFVSGKAHMRNATGETDIDA